MYEILLYFVGELIWAERDIHHADIFTALPSKPVSSQTYATRKDVACKLEENLYWLMKSSQFRYEELKRTLEKFDLKQHT